jgi:FkbM family methyltransferase
VRRKWQIHRINRAVGHEERALVRRLYEESFDRWESRRTSQTAPTVSLPLEPRVGHGRRVWVRPGTPDPIVYYQVFVETQYGVDLPYPVRTIVDCGAHIGLASAWLASRYQDATILAVEPDAANLALCRRNLDDVRDRVTLLHGAIWDHKGRLDVLQTHLGGWATTVQPATGCGDTPAFELGALFDAHGFDLVDLLKMDIEGAEKVVFAGTDLSWLDRVRSIHIELHGRECKEAFDRALQGKGFSYATRGEITVAVRAQA